MHSLREIGDNAAMIYEGKIIWSGAAKDIDNSGNAHVEQFVRGKAEGPIRMPVRSF
jgi:phospholipid/cholesterol/gamma-HCH transport system ATP-binding protein